MRPGINEATAWVVPNGALMSLSEKKRTPDPASDGEVKNGPPAIHFWFGLLLGLFFIVSGVGKMLDVNSFKSALELYGVPGWLTVVAIPIPSLEILLGLALLFNGPARSLVLASLLSLIFFTLAFAYGHFVQGVQDCGCFGRLTVLQSSPIASFLRNAALILFCLYLYRVKQRKEPRPLAGWQWLTLAVAGALAFMLSGISSVTPLLQSGPSFLHKQISATPLVHYIEPEAVSPYVIFAYSTSCSSCWDAIENVKTYKETGLVQKIYGLTYGDEIDLLEFEERFASNFGSKRIDPDSFNALVAQTPTLFYIENGEVRDVQTLTVMSAARFLEERLIGESSE